MIIRVNLSTLLELSMLIISSWPRIESITGSIKFKPIIWWSPLGRFRIIIFRVMIIRAICSKIKLVTIEAWRWNILLYSLSSRIMIIISWLQFELKCIMSYWMQRFVCSRSWILLVRTKVFSNKDSFLISISTCSKAIGRITLTVNWKGCCCIIGLKDCWDIVWIRWRRCLCYKSHFIETFTYNI